MLIVLYNTLLYFGLQFQMTDRPPVIDHILAFFSWWGHNGKLT